MYRVTMSESQLQLIADAMEDWHRFLGGESVMWHATSYLQNGKHVRECLRPIEREIVPELYPGQVYDWAGCGCKNKHQKKAIAMAYGIYRHILHFFAVRDNVENVYRHDTLTCEEQGGLIKIEEVEA